MRAECPCGTVCISVILSVVFVALVAMKQQRSWCHFFHVCSQSTCLSLRAASEDPESETCVAEGVLKYWALTLYGSSMSYTEVKDRQRYCPVVLVEANDPNESQPDTQF